jgi:hypothetical protein
MTSRFSAQLYAATWIAAAATVIVFCPPANAAEIRVSHGESLQTALNAAQPGDVVLLEPGATFRGNFVLPVKTGSAFITVRSWTDDGQLPPPGVRMTPAYAPLLARIESPNNAPSLRVANGAHHWRLQFLDFPPTYLGYDDIIQIGSGSATSLSQVPSDIVVDRVYIHGHPVHGQKRGIALNGKNVTISSSWISDIKAVGMDAQAICGWNGPGPFLIVNNYLEAAGENFLLGGSDPAIANLVSADVTVRHNYMSRPMSWRAENWQVKNIFELKNARRVTVEYNVFENNWRSAQNGYAILFTPRNQGGQCPWCVVEDVTFQFNIVRNTGGGINLSGYDSPNVSGQTKNIVIRHNLFHGITQALGGSGWFLLIGDQPANIVVDHNTIDFDGTAVVYAHGGTAAAPLAIPGFRFTNNAARHRDYGINGANFAWGLGILTAYFPGAAVAGNWLAGGTAARYPPGNLFAGPFEDALPGAASGDYRPAPGGILIGAATDGTNIGADIAALLTGLEGVVAGHPATNPRPSQPIGFRITGRSGI